MTARQLKVNEVAIVLQKLVLHQASKCAVCGHPFTKRDGAVLDHNHTTGHVRGAIHRSCNGAEGKVRFKAMLCHTGISSEKFVIGLGKYLEHHSKPRINLIHPDHLSKEDKIKLQRRKRATKIKSRRLEK